MQSIRVQPSRCGTCPRSVRVQVDRAPMIPSADIPVAGSEQIITPEALTDAVSDATAAVSDAMGDAVATIVNSGVDPADASQSPLVLGGLALLGVLGAVAFAVQNKGDAGGGGALGGVGKAAGVARKDAVLVFGATGRIGRVAVKQLLDSGRTVIAASRTPERAQEVFGGMGIKAGKQSGGGALIVEGGIDISDESTLTAALFKGATQVLLCVGPVFGKQEDGSMGYLGGMTSERVDSEGVSNVAAKAAEFLTPEQAGKTQLVSASDVAGWIVKDDVIMGGKSSSALAAADSATEWAGNLVLEGGGFCAITSPELGADWSQYSGVAVRVKGEGQTLKFNIKTQDQNDPTAAYQATFDTEADEWTTVRLPWNEFVPVVRANTIRDGKPLDPSIVTSIGLVLSRFNFNGAPNPNFSAGAFNMEIGAISGYKEAKPSVVMVTSAGVERNAWIGDNDELRVQDIPIVQLNPTGTLNWKYKGELAVRACGLPYTVIRPVGLTDEDSELPYTFEVSQGDRLSGKIGREDAGGLAAAALGTSLASNKTFEVRRSTGVLKTGGMQTVDAQEIERLLLRVVPDGKRLQVGIHPFPAWIKPNAPVTEERKAEILADPRVKAARARDVRTNTKAEIDTSVKAPAAAAPKKEEAPAPKEADAPAAKTDKQAEFDQLAANRAEVTAWVESYRTRSPAAVSSEGAVAAAGVVPPAGESAASSNGSTGASASASSAESAAMEANIAEVGKWIAAYRARGTQEAAAPKEDSSASAAVSAATEDAEKWISKWRASQ